MAVISQETPSSDNGVRRIFHIEVGNLPKERAMEYVRQCMDEYLAEFKDGKTIFAPMRHGKKSIEVETFKTGE